MQKKAELAKLQMTLAKEQQLSNPHQIAPIASPALQPDARNVRGPIARMIPSPQQSASVRNQNRQIDSSLIPRQFSGKTQHPNSGRKLVFAQQPHQQYRVQRKHNARDQSFKQSIESETHDKQLVRQRKSTASFDQKVKPSSDQEAPELNFLDFFAD